MGTESAVTTAGASTILIVDVGNFAVLKDNIITDNYAASVGARVFIDEGASATMTNNLVVRNTGPENMNGGAGVYVDGDTNVGSSLTMVNCTVADNGGESLVGGNVIMVENRSTVTARDCVF